MHLVLVPLDAPIIREGLLRVVCAVLLLGWELRQGERVVGSGLVCAQAVCPGVGPGQKAGCQRAGGGSGSLEDTLAQSELGLVPETTRLPSSVLLVPGAMLGVGHAAVSCGHASTESDCHVTRQGPQVQSVSIGEPSCGQMSSLMP